MLLTSGLRRGELLGLRWSDIRTDGLYVRQTVTVAKNQAIISPSKTEDSERFVDLSQDTILVLAEHMRKQAVQRQLVGEAWQDHNLVFSNALGAPMHPRNFYRAWRRALEQAQVPHARIHDIRHLHLSRLALLGIEAKQISERAGHSTTSFTLDRYIKSFRHQRANAALSLDELFGDTTASSSEETEQRMALFAGQRQRNLGLFSDCLKEVGRKVAEIWMYKKGALTCSRGSSRA